MIIKMKKKSNNLNHSMTLCCVLFFIVVLRVPVLFDGQAVKAHETQSKGVVQETPEHLEKNKKSLQGKWVLENVSAIEDGVEVIPFSMDSISCCEIATEIDIQHDVITFTFSSGEQKLNFEQVIKKNAFYFPFYSGWKIVDDKLQLHWGHDVDRLEGTIIQTIVLTYKLK